MPTWEEELHQQIVANVNVTHQLVATAQAFFMKIIEDRAKGADVLDQLLIHNDADWPKKLTLDPKADNSDVVSQLARAISIKVAGVEAIWMLVHRGQLLSPGTQVNIPVTIDLLTAHGGSGFTLHEFELPYPGTVIRAPSQIGSEALCNHDLYIKDLDVPGLSKDVESSLRDAIECFAAELYTPCAAMLGSASEGAWLELGHSLAEHLALSDSELANNLRKKLVNPYDSIAKKINLVFKQYSNGDLFAALWEKSGVAPKTLQHIMIWSDTVRDSRNSIHYGVDPRIPNAREKLATLLLGAVPFFRTLYSIAASIESGE